VTALPLLEIVVVMLPVAEALMEEMTEETDDPTLPVKEVNEAEAEEIEPEIEAETDEAEAESEAPEAEELAETN